MSVNAARGEVGLDVSGEIYPICLTLGALAEIETGLGCDTLSELDVRMRNLSAADLVLVLRALLRGGGQAELSETLCETQLKPSIAAAAVAEAFQLGLTR